MVILWLIINYYIIFTATYTVLKNNKHPGSDGLPAELFKFRCKTFIEQIHKIIVKACTEEQMPDEMCTGIIWPLHKNGDQLKCKNYKGITLFNTIYIIGRWVPGLWSSKRKNIPSF